MKMKIAILTIAAAVLSGCSSDPKTIPYTGGSVCEHAKLVLIQRTQEWETSSFQDIATPEYYRLEHARANVNSLCEAEEKDGAWACAEGHSCK